MKMNLNSPTVSNQPIFRGVARGAYRRNINGEGGSALILTVVILACALVVLAAAMAWSNTHVELTDRAKRYMAATAAAEAATELVVSRISRDYLNGGEALVLASVTNY